jgi:hypothetical protein
MTDESHINSQQRQASFLISRSSMFMVRPTHHSVSSGALCLEVNQLEHEAYLLLPSCSEVKNE